MLSHISSSNYIFLRNSLIWLNKGDFRNCFSMHFVFGNDNQNIYTTTRYYKNAFEKLLIRLYLTNLMLFVGKYTQKS